MENLLFELLDSVRSSRLYRIFLKWFLLLKRAKWPWLHFGNA